MKLRNKKTGEILDLGSFIIKNPNRINCESIMNYDSLSELNEDWEDYEEQQSYWYYDTTSNDVEETYALVSVEKDKEIGNYFETKEEAEKAVEKFKAWKRLKDKGFRFHEWYKPDGCEPFICIETNISKEDVYNWELYKDLDLLFGGE